MPTTGIPVRMLVDPTEILSQFVTGNHGPDPKGTNSLGYDIRLGDRVFFVTRGTSVTFDERVTEVDVNPGETILAQSLEVLKLDEDVCATGSPKMRLLIRGLWAHGGKTDFGYNSTLMLGFTNLGTKPIPLRHKQQIFHITLWKVPGQPNGSYQGPAPLPSDVMQSPLDTPRKMSLELDREVMRRDGYTYARLLRVMRWHQRKIDRVVVTLLSTLLAALATIGIGIYEPDIQALVAVLTALEIGGGALLGAYAYFRKPASSEAEFQDTLA